MGKLTASRDHVIDVATRFQAARVLHVAVAAGLVGELDDRRSAVDDVATAHGWHRGRTRHLLDALVSLGVLEQHESGYAATADARRYLGAPGLESVAAMVLHEHAQQGLWIEMDDVLRTKGARADQQDLTMVHEPGRLPTLLRAMQSLDRWLPDVIADLPEWNAHRHVVDLAGGHGELLARIAQRHPDLTGVVLDQGPAEPVAHDTFRAFDVLDRCSFRVTDLAGHDPLVGCETADAVLAARCLHNFDADTIRRILGASRLLLEPGGLLVVVDVHLELKEGAMVPADAAIFSSYMAMNCRGGWIPPVSWWRDELAQLGGDVRATRAGPYDIFFVEW